MHIRETSQSSARYHVLTAACPWATLRGSPCEASRIQTMGHGGTRGIQPCHIGPTNLSNIHRQGKSGCQKIFCTLASYAAGFAASGSQSRTSLLGTMSSKATTISPPLSPGTKIEIGYDLVARRVPASNRRINPFKSSVSSLVRFLAPSTIMLRMRGELECPQHERRVRSLPFIWSKERAVL